MSSIGILFSVEDKKIQVLDFEDMIGFSAPKGVSKIMLDELEFLQKLFLSNPDKNIKEGLELLRDQMGYSLEDSTGEMFNDIPDDLLIEEIN